MLRRTYVWGIFILGIGIGILAWNIATLTLPTSAYAQERGEELGVSSGGLIAVTGLCSNSYSGLWLIDTKSSDNDKSPSLCLYIPENGGKSFKLAAARRIKWDFQLPQYNDTTDRRMSPSKMKEEIARIEKEEKEKKEKEEKHK